jgi:hypothetical protein
MNIQELIKEHTDTCQELHALNTQFVVQATKPVFDRTGIEILIGDTVTVHDCQYLVVGRIWGTHVRLHTGASVTPRACEKKAN